MGLAIGTDIVYIPRLKKLGDEALRRMLHANELVDGRVEHLAGVVAAKEALFKALGTPPRWLEAELVYGGRGEPSFKLAAGVLPSRARAVVSISHDHEYAVAFVTIIDDAAI